MNLTPQQIAEAFSGHRFEITYPYFLEDMVWNNVGGEQLKGKEAVIQACEQSSQYLQTATTTFKKFQVITADQAVVIDSLADYSDADHAVITVASCDIYRFVENKISEIVSYTVEVKPN